MTSSVYIAKNVYGGDGLGRLGDGRVVFVPGAWAGEQVKAEIVEEKRHFVRARLVEVEEKSPHRLEPAAIGPTVPGMVYAGLDDAGEREAKERQLVDFFERARLPVPKPEGQKTLRVDIPGETPLNYRNKAVYHFARQKGAWAIGYRVEPSNEIVDVANDPLAAKAINAALPEVRRSVLSLLTTGPEAVRRDTARKGSVTVRWSARTGVKWWLGEPPKDLVVKEDTCGRIFEVPAGGFYQVNPVVGEALVKAVAAEYARGAAETPNILDLYCGVGVFGLACRPPKLVGIESGRAAVDFARRNAAAQGADSARFFAETVAGNTKRIAVGRQTTVIVDPPRGGLEPRVPDWLAKSPAPRILCVSCDPATLVRDLRVLATAYEIESVRWFDMFPRTARFETLVVLRRRG